MKLKTSGLIKKSAAAVSLCIIFLCAGTSVSAQEKNAALLGYMIIPDIVQTMDRIGKIASAADPRRYNPDVLKSQAGTMLGDPSLENIDRTMPIVLMLFQNTTQGTAAGSIITDIEYAAVIAVKDKARYMDALGKLNLPFETNGNKIILSNKKSSLFFAQKEMKLYRKISSQMNRYDARVLVNISSIMSANNTAIEMLLNQFRMLENSGLYYGQDKKNESLIAIGKIFVYAMLDLALQSKDYQFDVSIGETAIDFSGDYSAVQDSPLGRFFDGEPQSENRSLSLLPEKGQLTYAGYFDMKRFREFVESILAGVLKRDPSLEEHINRDLINAYLDYTKLYQGEFAVTYGFNSSNMLQINAAAETDSTAEEHAAVNERFMTLYNEVLKKNDGGVSGFKGYTIQKNYRKSGDVDVHRYIMDMSDAAMTEMEKEMMQKMFGKEFSIEYAVSGGYIAASTDPASLDKIIANTITHPEAMELQSMKAFGAGMDSYADFDIISFIESIIELTSTSAAEKDPETGRVENMLKNLNPDDRNLLFSSKYSKGTSYNKYRISNRLVIEILKAASEQKKAESDTEDSAEIVPEDESGE